jgi:nucleotide-binding universal stress UspA family protein
MHEEVSTMTRVLIAVDGSIESNDAAQFAHRLFGDGVEYVVVTVAETGSFVGGALPIADPAFSGGAAYISPEVARESVENAIQDAEETAAEAVAQGDFHAKTIVEAGDPGESIIVVAEEQNVDLIVVGSHDRNWLSRLLTPSVRNHLVDHAPCPVLVVR